MENSCAVFWRENVYFSKSLNPGESGKVKCRTLESMRWIRKTGLAF